MAEYTVSFTDEEGLAVEEAANLFNAEKRLIDPEHVDIDDRQYFQHVTKDWVQSYVNQFKGKKALERAKKIEKLDIGKAAQVDAILATVVEEVEEVEEGEVIVVP